MGDQPQPDPTVASSAEGAFIVHAVLPPPVTGMTLCTQGVIDAISSRFPVRTFNWSDGSSKITPIFRAKKAVRALLTPWILLLGRRPHRGIFYMPANAGYAAFYNFFALSAARLRGYVCVLHHHHFRYVDDFEWRTKLLTSVLGPNDLQIVLCPEMERGFRAQYGDHQSLAVMPSTIQLLSTGTECSPLPDTAAAHAGPFCLGHISNLQLAKGLDLVLQVFRVLRDRGRDVRLIMAGPTDTAVERRMVEAAQAEFGDRLDYRGPVYGAAKQQFFQDIHAHVFPTRLDAQPLVIMESFSHGRPVISYGRGCIPGMMPRSEWSICTKGDFVQPAVKLVERWMDDEFDYAESCQLAQRQFVAALDDARAALDNFVNWVCGEPDHGFVHRGPNGSSSDSSVGG